MKYIKLYESEDDWKDELNSFHKKMMGKIKSSIELNKQYNFIDKNKIEIKEFLDEYIFTINFRSEIESIYKIGVPLHTFLAKKSGVKETSTEHHTRYRWTIQDNITENRSNFILEISIEIPKQEEFRLDNTMLNLSVYIKPKNNRKEFFDMFNTCILPNDDDGNFVKLIDMIKNFGNKINQDIKQEIKLSNKYTIDEEGLKIKNK